MDAKLKSYNDSVIGSCCNDIVHVIDRYEEIFPSLKRDDELWLIPYQNLQVQVEKANVVHGLAPSGESRVVEWEKNCCDI